MLLEFVLRVLALGSLTFGGGYGMISALQQEFVFRRGWLTPDEFANGVAAGQLTPGPLMVMIAFMGYRIAGFWGALLGTLGLFLPTAVLVVALGRYYRKARPGRLADAALKGVNAAVVSLLAAASLSLGRSIGSSPVALGFAAVAALLAGVWRLDPALVVIAAGLLGAWFLG